MLDLFQSSYLRRWTSVSCWMACGPLVALFMPPRGRLGHPSCSPRPGPTGSSAAPQMRRFAALPMQRPSCASTTPGKPSNSGLADQEMADVQLHHLRDRGDRRRRCRRSGRGRHGIRGRARGQCAPPPRCRPRARRRAPFGIGAGVQFDDVGAERGRRLELARVRVDEQRDADAGVRAARARPRRAAPAWPAASSPPSVVTSWRRSGTRQHACGRSSARSDHLLGRRHLEIQRHVGRVRESAGDRLADMAPILRRWTVIPSAPAAHRHRAAATGSGCAPPRALRMVATWSTFTPERGSVSCAHHAPPCAARPCLAASRSAAIRLLGSARPLPAMSNAVPWSGEVRTIGRPSVTFTPSPNVQRLQRDQRLVVVHADGGVVAGAGGLGEHACPAARGPVTSMPSRAGPAMAGAMISPPRRPCAPLLAGVGIEAGDREPRARDAEVAAQRLAVMRATDDDALAVEHVRHPAQRDVDGDRDDAQIRRWPASSPRMPRRAGQRGRGTRYGPGCRKPAW